MLASVFHCGSFGSFMNAIEIVPLTSLFWPSSDALTIVAAPAPTALLITRFGFQPSLFAIEYAWTANVRRREDGQRVGAGRLQLRNLRRDVDRS